MRESVKRFFPIDPSDPRGHIFSSYRLGNPRDSGSDHIQLREQARAHGGDGGGVRGRHQGFFGDNSNGFRPARAERF